MTTARAGIEGLIKKALKEGLSASEFISRMRDKGLSYRRTDMLADWRTVGNIAKVEGAIRFVRKDYLPSANVIAVVNYAFSIPNEFMYLVKVRTQRRAGEPIVTHSVNIMSEKALTPAQVEQQVEQKWGEWENYKGERIKDLQVWTAYRKEPD